VAVGETVTGLPLRLPGSHTYVVAPEPVRSVEPPLHIVGLVAEAVTVGVGVTVTVICAWLVQPFAPVPVTVYVVVVVGVTVTGEPFRFPGFHVYDVAPLPLRSVEPPLQMVVLVADAVTVGVGLTVTVTCPWLVQPFAPVPVTVYVVVVVGETVTGFPLKLPGIHVYEVAPEPVRSVEPPLQMVGLVAVAVTVGVGFTVTVTCAWLEHPPLVPVTVYVVVVVGVTVTGFPLRFPGFHTYVVAPEPLRSVEPPLQMVGLVAVAVTVGVGFTVTVTCAWLVQPFAPVPVIV
jgi:hypothetical protein